MDKLALSFAGFSCDWSDLPENSKAALAALGFSTKIKNAIAGVKAGVKGEGKNPWSDDDLASEAARIGLTTWGRDDATADAITAAMQKEMFAAILSGDLSSTRRTAAPRLSDDDKLRQSIATELLVNAAKAKGKELPKRSKPDEKEAFAALLAKALSDDRFAKAVEKEFTDRKKKAAKALEGLDDLFA
jgi:hypothetical protein